MKILTLLINLLVLSNQYNVENKIVQTQEFVSDYDWVSEIAFESQKQDSTIVVVSTPKQYSKNFIKKFKNSHTYFETIEFKNDSIIINKDKSEALIFPKGIPIGKQFTFSNEDLKFTLHLKRINYTTIKSVLEIGKTMKTSILDLDEKFYLGSNITYENKNEDVYELFKFLSEENDCESYLHMGSNLNVIYFYDSCNMKEPVEMFNQL